MSLLSERAKKRTDKQRNQRVILIFIAALILAGAAFLIHQFYPIKDTKPANATTISSGLQIQDIKIGGGEEAREGNLVVVHYKGTFEDGKKFDSSVDRDKPFEFTLGEGMVIRGWDEGIQGMRVGGKRLLTIPPDLAYGEDGYAGVIPPNAVLIFEVELLDIN